MIGLGTIINTGAILAGGVIGMVLKNALPKRVQDAVVQATGASTLFIGISGAMEEMLKVDGAALTASGSLLIILSFALGSVLGAWLDIDGAVARFGVWLRRRAGSEGDSSFLDAFVTSSLTVCIGAMAIVGSIRDGIAGDYTLLAAKALLDFIIIMILASSMGKGAVFSAIPVFLLQGGVTLLARFLQGVMTDAALSCLSMTGSILIFCVGVNLIWENKMKVANMLPTVLFAVILSFIIRV